MEERKVATVVFTDLSGFTKLCEKLDPEEIKNILEKIFGVIEENTIRYRGKLIKVIGDCVLSVFGIPVALENSAENALNAVYYSYGTMKEISKELPFTIKLHTGVHTGEVLYEIFKDGKMDILGDAVNTASRLQGIAGEDEIVVSKEVYLRAKHIFDFEYAGKVKVKGKEFPLEIYKLKGKKERRGKIRGLEEMRIPMIGREKELNKILKRFDEFLKEKKDFIVIIKGDPGIGKTRLYEEFKNIKEEEASFLEGRSLPYEITPFYPVISFINQLIVKKGRNFIEKLFPDGKAGFIPISPFIDSLLKNEIHDSIKNLSPREFKKQKFFVVESILRKISEKENIVLVFEDLHWADEETFDFLKFIFSSMESDKGIFFVLLTRPPIKEKKLIEFLNFLKGFENKLIFELKPFDYSKSKEFIDRILTIARIPSQIKEKILFEKSGGNPFFIEELIKYLIDRGIIYREGNEWKSRLIIDEIERAPLTIEEVLLSRIDSLSEEEKRFLKIASIIGNNFIVEGIDVITGNGLGKIKDNLIYSGFITKLDRKFLGFEEYSFKHVLVYETVYKTLLKSEKKHYHLKFAKWLEELYSKNYEIPESLIADHYEKGKDLKKAFLYNKKFAEKCRENYLNFEAIKRYEKLLEFIDKLKEFEDTKGNIYFELGRLYNLTGNFSKSTEYLRKALEISSEKDKPKILYEMGNAYQRVSLYTEALFYLDSSLKYVSGNEKLKCSILREKAWINYLIGNLEKCKEYLDICNELLNKIKEPEDREIRKAGIFNLLASYFSEKGEIKKAISYYKKALQIYDKTNDISGKAAIYNNLGGILYKEGLIEDGISMLKKSLETDKNIGNYLGYAITCNNLGEMYMLLYDLEEAEKYFLEYLSVNKRIKNRLGDGYGYLGLAEIKRRQNKLKEAEKFYIKSIEILKGVKSEVIEKRAKMCLSNFYLNTDKEKEGLKLLKEVSEYGKKNNHTPAIFCSHLIFAKYYINSFKKSNNHELLDMAFEYIKEAEELVNRFMKEKIAPIELLKTKIKFFELKKDRENIKMNRKILKEEVSKIINNIKNKKGKEGILKHKDFYYFIFS